LNVLADFLSRLVFFPHSASARRVLKYGTRLLRVSRLRSKYGVWLTPAFDDATFRFALYGTYGRFITEIIENLPRDTGFLDIGANQGIFSLVAGRHLNGTIFSFEPHPTLFCLLVRNLKLNGLANVVPVCAAVGPDAEDFISLRFDRQHTGSTEVKPYVGRGSQTSTALMIGTETFSSIARHMGNQCLVKIDTEGYELFVLRALFDSKLTANISGIIVELSNSMHSSDELVSIYHYLRERGFSEVSRSRDSEHYDAFFVPANTEAWAERKLSST
jgi:FkbM family methyltransferase